MGEIRAVELSIGTASFPGRGSVDCQERREKERRQRENAGRGGNWSYEPTMICREDGDWSLENLRFEKKGEEE